MSLAATLTMVLMLLLLAGFFILQNVLLASLAFVEQKVEVVAYVENTATQDQVDDAGRAGRRDAGDGVGGVRLPGRGAPSASARPRRRRAART